MVNSLKGKIGITLLGALLINAVMIFIERNILAKYMVAWIFVVLGFIALYYFYFHKYQVKNNDEMANKNKLLVCVTMIIEFIVLLGFVIEARYGKVDSAWAAQMAKGIVGDYLVNMCLFFAFEKFKYFRYLILFEFGLGYFSSGMLADEWIFMITLPVIIVCTIYADTKFFKIASAAFTIISIAIIVYKMLHITDQNPMYSLFIYFLVLSIYIIFSIAITRTSYVIKRVNNDKYSEMVSKREKMQKLSEDVIEVGRIIQNDAYSTNGLIEKVEAQTNKSLEVFDEIVKGNEVNVNSAKVQTEMTSNIMDMINDVKSEVTRALGATKSSYEGLLNSKKSVEDLEEKSVVIDNGNKEVIMAIEEFSMNVKKVKAIIADIADMSEQTNLLSLNADVESARAGDKGKDFSLVAGEMQSLALDTSNLTADMSRLISKLEKNTHKAKSVINEVVQSEQEERKVLRETVLEFDKMDEDLTGLKNNINSISDKVEEVLEYSCKIEEHSKKLLDSSNRANKKTIDVVSINEENKEKTMQTKELMSDLINIVGELDAYI